jgi:hypothetical protein
MTHPVVTFIAVNDRNVWKHNTNHPKYSALSQMIDQEPS